MPGLIECVPNLSEGRDLAAVGEIAGAVHAAKGVRLLGMETDPDHNRSVLTFVGPPEAVRDAALSCVEAAVARLDLSGHEGVHPRRGVVDVLPFAPLGASTLEACASIAGETARAIGKMDVPAYLYGAASPDGTALPDVRANPSRPADFGPKAPHPTAGAVCVGARPVLIAFNVNLKGGDLKTARKIAAAIRERGGGLPGVRALGFWLASRSVAQVSMNLCDYSRTSPLEAFRAVEEQALLAGAEVLESELVGLAPRDALAPGFEIATHCTNFHPEKILENA